MNNLLVQLPTAVKEALQSLLGFLLDILPSFKLYKLDFSSMYFLIVGLNFLSHLDPL